MAEQTTEQTAATQTGAAPVPGQTATGSTPAGSGLTSAQIQEALRANPDMLNQISLTTKVYGEEKPVALAEIAKGYQVSSAAQKQLQEAAQLKKELEAEKARLAEQGDPVKRFAEELSRRNGPQTPPDPLTQVDFDVDPITGGKVTAQQLAVERAARLQLEAKLKEIEESKLPQAQQFAQDAVNSYNAYRTMDDEFRGVQKDIPGFSARAIFENGKPVIDPGSDPLTIATLRLANSDIPDPRFGNRPPKELPLKEIYLTLENDLRGRFTANEKARIEQAERERRTAASVAAATGEAPALPTELAFTGKETREERLAKAEKIRDYYLNLAKP